MRGRKRDIQMVYYSQVLGPLSGSMWGSGGGGVVTNTEDRAKYTCTQRERERAILQEANNLGTRSGEE